MLVRRKAAALRTSRAAPARIEERLPPDELRSKDQPAHEPAPDQAHRTRDVLDSSGSVRTAPVSVEGELGGVPEPDATLGRYEVLNSAALG